VIIMDKEQINNYIREHIRMAREEANMTQEQLGAVIGKTNVNISDIERGRLGISASDLAVLSIAMKKPISYFFPVFQEEHIAISSDRENELILYFRQITNAHLENIVIEVTKSLRDFIAKGQR